MKVIDLLNTPLDELPKKIKMEDKTYTLFIDEDTNYHYYQDDKCKYFMLSISCLEELNEEVEIIEEKEETKPVTKESIEALGYACEEIQKCFINGWKNSLKNKQLNEEDKKIEKIEPTNYCTDTLREKINEIIDKINSMEEK